MIAILRIFALAMFVACLPGQARSEVWVDPAGVFSINVSAPTWSIADRAEHPNWFFADFVVLAYTGLEDGRPVNLCYALIDARTPAPSPGPEARERMNVATQQLEHSPTIAGMNQRGVRLERVEVVEIDGVAVLDIYGRFGALDTVQRRFFVYEAGEVRMYTLSCSVNALDREAVAASRAIAASLRFPRRGQ